MPNPKSTKPTKSTNPTSSTQNLNQSDTVQLRGRSVERMAPVPKSKGPKRDPPEPIPEQDNQSSDAALAAELVGTGPSQTAPLTAPLATPLTAPMTAPLVTPLTAPSTTPLNAPSTSPLTSPLTAPLTATDNEGGHVKEIVQMLNHTSNLQDPALAATIAEQAAASAKKRHLRVNANSKPKPIEVFHDASDDFRPTYYPISPSYPNRSLEDLDIAPGFQRRLERIVQPTSIFDYDATPSGSKQPPGKDKGKQPIRGERGSRFADALSGLGSSLDKNPFYSIRPQSPKSPTTRRSHSASPASRATSLSPNSPEIAPRQTNSASLFVTPRPTTLLTNHATKSAPATVNAPAAPPFNNAMQGINPPAVATTHPIAPVIHPVTIPTSLVSPVTPLPPAIPLPPVTLQPQAVPLPPATPLTSQIPAAHTLPPPPPPSVNLPPTPPVFHTVPPPPPPPPFTQPDQLQLQTTTAHATPPPPPPPSANAPPFPPVFHATPPPPPPPPVAQLDQTVTTFPVDWPERIHGFTSANRLLGLVPAQEQQWDRVDTTTSSKVLVQRTGGYPAGDTPYDIGQAIVKAFQTIFQVTPYIGAPGLNESGRVDQSCPWYLVYNVPPHVAASVVGRAWSVRDVISFIAIPYNPTPSSYIFTLDSIWLMNLEVGTTAEQFIANVITRTWRETPAIMQFLTTFMDALPENTTIDQYLQTLLVRPLPFERKTVYRVYITPPTNQLHLYDTWLSLVLAQPYVFVSGIGKALSHFKCSWCRSIDHPSNFCPWTKYVTWYGPSAATQAAASLNTANNTNQPYTNNNPSNSSYPSQYQDDFNNGLQNQGGSRGGYRGGYRGNFRGGYNDNRGRGSRRSRGSRGGRGYFGGY
ncbi:hypothetical protein K435DRAFT_875064 [Dendrothele bispora CBS 962.96]|uniref:Uncharacterized protein n=1 Tax=Dendrothele bispora (strain CBS 962.96) TaxID=1314807 RepID=A0A4S8KV46_DENBC|nr:hypothetical protein K435DRAFT_875064 [Dendrothele bispora CBS 962.96]